jgi:hypothetical protein
MRSNKGINHKNKLKLNLKLNIGHFPRRIKLKLPKSRNHQRRRRGAHITMFVVRRGTLPLHT